MGQFDDAVKESVPNNDYIKPLAIAAGALILGHFFGGNRQEGPPGSVPQTAPGAGTLGGGGFVNRFALPCPAKGNGMNTVVPACCSHLPYGPRPIPKCSRYQAASFFGSCARKKNPPIPVTVMFPSSKP